MLVSDAVARVRNYIDDQGNSADSRWSDEEIKISLEMSLDLLVTEAVQAGVHQPFRLNATSTLSNGQIVVPEHWKIISLFLGQRFEYLLLVLLHFSSHNCMIYGHLISGNKKQKENIYGYGITLVLLSANLLILHYLCLLLFMQ